MGRYGVERMDLAEATEGHYPTHMGRDKNTEKRSISVRKGRWKEWEDVAWEMRLSVSGLVERAVTEAIRNFRGAKSVSTVAPSTVAQSPRSGTREPQTGAGVSPGGTATAGNTAPGRTTAQRAVGSSPQSEEFCQRPGCLNYQTPEHTPFCSERCEPKPT